MVQTLQPKAPRTRLHTLFLIMIVAVAVVAIAASIYVVMNPAGIQTAATEPSSAVTITDRGVAPSTITVKKGNSITWTNQDAIAHRLVITTPNAPQELQGFGSDEPTAKGESYSFVFEVAGTFTYEDPQYPNTVRGTIVVE
jgi:plastocyanin